MTLHSTRGRMSWRQGSRPLRLCAGISIAAFASSYPLARSSPQSRRRPQSPRTAKDVQLHPPAFAMANSHRIPCYRHTAKYHHTADYRVPRCSLGSLPVHHHAPAHRAGYHPAASLALPPQANPLLYFLLVAASTATQQLAKRYLLIASTVALYACIFVGGTRRKAGGRSTGQGYRSRRRPGLAAGGLPPWSYRQPIGLCRVLWVQGQVFILPLLSRARQGLWFFDLGIFPFISTGGALYWWRGSRRCPGGGHWR